VLLGVLIFQFLERVPDRQAAELVKYHLGWKLALNLKLKADGFHPTTLAFPTTPLQREPGVFPESQSRFDAMAITASRRGSAKHTASGLPVRVT
jgi:hypothetical protein